MDAIGIEFKPSILTTENFDSQFWNAFDGCFGLTEVSMREELPNLI